MAEFIVGVTGGIGSGKTLVTDAFAAKGVAIADADEAARHIVEPGQPALAQIVAHFGEAITDSSGRLDRPKLREIIFNDVDARRQLESAMSKHACAMRCGLGMCANAVRR